MSNLDPWWLAPWRPLLDRSVLAQRMAAVPRPLSGLDKMPARLAAKALDDALGEVFQVSEQSLDLGEVIVASAVHHLQSKYSNDDGGYLMKVNSRVVSGKDDFIPPIPITGHAGAGKSSILAAVQRAVGSVMPIMIGGINVLPVPFKLVPVGIAKSQLAVARRAGGLGKNLEECSLSAQRILYRDGTAMIAFGELQFVNQSAKANTLVSGILLQGGYLGLPSAYDANFSLMWRLRRRPPEERDRLLFEPVVVYPDIPGSPDSIAASEAMIAVAPDVFAIDLVKDGNDLDNRCGGLRRMKRRLLSISYMMKRVETRKGAVCVTIDDIIRAYKSNAFKESRLTVEEIAGRRDRIDHREDDLSCPFDEPLSAAQAREKAIKEFRNEQVAEKEVGSAMTADEKRLVAEREKRPGKNDTSRNTSRGPGASKRATSGERAQNSAALAAEFS